MSSSSSSTAKGKESKPSKGPIFKLPFGIAQPTPATSSNTNPASTDPNSRSSSPTKSSSPFSFPKSTSSDSTPATTGFGTPSAGTSGFGSSSTPSTTPFGSTSNATPAFGASPFGPFGSGTSTTSGFGSTQPQPPKASAFGATTPTGSNAAPATSGFGASTTTTASSAFGSSSNAPNTTTAFGSSGSKATTTSAFGSSSNAPNTSAFGSTGSTATATPGPAFGFAPFGSSGSNPNTNSAFGSSSNAPTWAFGSPNSDTPGFGGFTAFASPFGSSTPTNPSKSVFEPVGGSLYPSQREHLLKDQLAREQAEVESLKQLVTALTLDNDLLRRKAQAALETTQTHEKNWVAVESLLKQSGVLPYTLLLTHLNRFNDAVATIAAFLAQNVVCRSSDAFQEELDRAAGDVQMLMGPRLAGLLLSQGQEADNGSEKPHAQLVLILLQIFIVRFTIQGISKTHYYTDKDSPKDSQPLDARPLEAFKSSLLKNLSSIMKTASWAIPTRQSRLTFEGALLDSLFEAKENLRAAVENTFAETDVEIVVVDHAVSFNDDSMLDIFPSLPNDETSAQKQADNDVVGTMGVGLRKAGKAEKSEEDGNVLVLRPQVVLELTLQKALKGEPAKEAEPNTGADTQRDCDGRA